MKLNLCVNPDANILEGNSRTIVTTENSQKMLDESSNSKHNESKDGKLVNWILQAICVEVVMGLVLRRGSSRMQFEPPMLQTVGRKCSGGRLTTPKKAQLPQIHTKQTR